MKALYRKLFVLPSLLLLVAGGCDGEPPPDTRTSTAESNRYLEAVQEAEALKHAIEQHDLETRRIEQLLQPDQAPSR